MPYELPVTIADKHQVSLKTVYNYLSRYGGKIRTQKQYWKKFVNVEDFESFYLQNIQSEHWAGTDNGHTKALWSGAESTETFVTEVTKPLQSPAASPAENGTGKPVWNDTELANATLQKLQSDYTALQSEKANTEKYNLALQEQVKEFALTAIAERNEKKERIDKHAAVQKDYVAVIKKLYLSVGVVIVLLTVTGLLLRLQFQP